MIQVLAILISFLNEVKLLLNIKVKVRVNVNVRQDWNGLELQELIGQDKV